MLKRVVARSLLALAIIPVLLIVTLLLYREYSQVRLEAATRIVASNGIEALEPVELNGASQWIYLRGHDQDNPVLLFLHGGPGMTEMPIARSFGLELEKHFTVVHWDQRGSGKSRTGEPLEDKLTIQTYLDDVLALTHHLRARFDKEKIYLVGHSWGTLLGTLTVRDHPALYHAYVGLGQIANMQRNEVLSLAYVRDRARADGNTKALEELAGIDPANYSQDMSQLQTQRKWLYWYEGGFRGMSIAELVWQYLSSPEYSLGDLRSLLLGSNELPALLWGEVMQVDLIQGAARLELPVYFFAGAYDYNTPSELAEEYFNVLNAPEKHFVWFPESSHLMNVTAPEQFQDVLINRVLLER